MNYMNKHIDIIDKIFSDFPLRYFIKPFHCQFLLASHKIEPIINEDKIDFIVQAEMSGVDKVDVQGSVDPMLRRLGMPHMMFTHGPGPLSLGH